MAFNTATVLNAGTKCLVGNLLANRILPVKNLIVGTAGATEGDTEIPLKVASGTTQLLAGTAIQFSDVTPVVTVIVAEDTSVAATDTLVPIQSALSAGETLVAADAGVSNGLLQVLGGKDLTFDIKDNEVGTRSFESGLFDDARKVMVGGTITWGGHYVIGDNAIETVIEPAALSEDEIYIRLLYPDGKVREAACFIMGFSEKGTLDGIRELNWTYRLVGEIKMYSTTVA
jgi:hypothetical protein